MNNLTESEIRTLHEALDDEYHAWATYDQVIADFGEVRPFSNIREAEARHIEALCTLFARYGLPVPENTWPGRVARYVSTLSRRYCHVQRDEKQLAARRATAALAIVNTREHNNADSRLSPRPKGAPQMRHYGVAVLEKGAPFPADCALY